MLWEHLQKFFLPYETAVSGSVGDRWWLLDWQLPSNHLMSTWPMGFYILGLIDFLNGNGSVFINKSFSNEVAPSLTAVKSHFVPRALWWFGPSVPHTGQSSKITWALFVTPHLTLHALRTECCSTSPAVTRRSSDCWTLTGEMRVFDKVLPWWMPGYGCPCSGPSRPSTHPPIQPSTHPSVYDDTKANSTDYSSVIDWFHIIKCKEGSELRHTQLQNQRVLWWNVKA